MGHSHGSLASSESPSSLLRIRLGAVLLITVAVCSAQFIGAALTGSIALLTESVHMIVDLIGLSIAFGAALMASRLTAAKQLRVEAISALIQSTLLLGVGIYAAIRGLQGLIDPHPISGGFLLIFASVGLIANLACVGILYGGRRANLNLRAAFLEVLSDALGSLAVIGAALAVVLAGFYQADGIAALALALLMITRGMGILRLAISQLFPRWRILAMGAALTVALGVGLGVGQLHQLFLPSHLHLPLPAADSYAWSSSANGKLQLSFSSESDLATLSSDCGTATSSYELIFGGVVFEGFGALDPDCSGSQLEELLGTQSAYFGENFESLKLLGDPDEQLAVLISEERSADQRAADSWKPLLELLFRL